MFEIETKREKKRGLLLNLLLDKGEIAPSLLKSDKDLQERISRHPLLEWKALNVRQYKGQ